MVKNSIRIIALILVAAFVLPLIAGCKQDNLIEISDTSDVSSVWLTEAESDSIDINKPTIDVIVSPMKIMSSPKDNWETFVGDIETFVYGLIISVLQESYSTFSGYVSLSNGYNAYGIAYTNYEECYANEDESQVAFTAGFLPFVGELEITQDEFDSGLTIHDLDYENDDTSFILTYMSDPFKDHCVVYNQYLIYGVDENGKIFYSYSKYKERSCDESIGSLYSYDEERALFLSAEDVGEYLNITGKSLSSQIDFASLEKEINETIEKQDFNFSSVDLEFCAYIAQEAITSYLLSMQEETFLGFSVSTLIELTKQLDPKDCIRIADSGLSVVSIEPVPEKKADDLTRWLVGTGCVIVAAVGCVASIVFVEIPPLSSLASAMMGTAVEIFMQVAINATALENINWTKVAISAAVGAVSGFLGPYVVAATQGASYAVYFIADSTIDGLLAGIEATVLSVLEGKQGLDLLKSFGTGFAIGFAVSGAFKAIAKVLSKAASKVSSFANKIAPNLTKRVSKISDALSKGMHKLKTKVDGLKFHSKYISKKLSSGYLVTKSFDKLKVDDIYDNSGNMITKTKLKELFEEAGDGSTIGFFETEGVKVSIIKQNEMVSIKYPSDFPSYKIPMTNDREANFLYVTNKMKEDPSSIPAEIKKAISETYPEISFEDIEPQKIVAVIKDTSNGWVFHENIDMESITLVPRAIHDKTFETGISHMGGFALIDYLKTGAARLYFERIVQAVSSWTSAQVALITGD